MATSQFSSTNRADQTFSHSKDANRLRRINVHMIQNVLLIWLDKNIDETNNDCQNTIAQLQSIVNTFHKFTNTDECIEFLNDIETDKVCMIISGSLGQTIMPHIHNMLQLDSVFIFCGNQAVHEAWAKEWPKIKGVYTKITPICEALKEAAQQCEQNAISISFMKITGDISKKNLNQLDASFMYTQILKEILLTIKFEQKHITEFIEYCREILGNNASELKKLNKLKKYSERTPIWWYTYNSFLYPMVNRALRALDTDLIIKLGFFIADLHRHIEQLHKDQYSNHRFNEILTLYRGQALSKDDFKTMTETKGGLLSFNCFVSTSKSRKVAVGFTENARKNPDLVGIIFVMNIDPNKSTTPFAAVGDFGYYGNREEEVLFSMHTVFRIGDIKSVDKDQRLYQVNLTLTNDNDQDLCLLMNRIREEVKGSTGWDRLGELLLKMGQPEKAEQVYEILLEQTTDECEKAHIYHQFGWAKDDLGQNEDALDWYEKALAIQQEYLPENHLDLAKTYTGIGFVYENMCEYSDALIAHEKALEIRQQSLPTNHPDLAVSYNNIGIVYGHMEEYAKALSFHEKALKIRQQSLATNHLDTAKSYGNIGLVYSNMGEYSKALSSYEKALEIKKRSLPSNHPNLAASYNSIGHVYQNMKDYTNARSFYKRAIEIAEQSLPAKHPDLKMYKDNFDIVKKKV